MKVKNLLVTLIAACMVFALAACGSSNESSEKYIAVTEPTYPPFESTDEDGNLVGFDIDLINAIAEDQGFEIEMQEMEFSALIPAVESGQADMVIAGISENEERREHVMFTDAYYDSGNYLIVMADSQYNAESELPSDAKIACQTGTTSASYVQAMYDDGKCAEPVVLDQHSNCFLQLENGDVDAVVGDLPVLEEYINKNPDKYKLIGKFSYETGDGLLKMAVAKDNDELKEKLNTGLQNLKDNGTYAELCEKWGITPLED